MTQTRIIEPTTPTRVICVVVHGRGQTQDDMMASIVRHLPAEGVRFVLPKSAGAGWYAARAVDPLTAVTRDEVARSLSALGDVIDEARSAHPDARILLAGFSQGACLSVEYLMQATQPVSAAALLTGCRVGARSDAPPVANLARMPVYATCGDDDPWIPAAAYHDMLGDLTRASARIRTDMFPGRPHEVAPAEIAVVAAMLADLAHGRSLFEGAGS